VDGYDSGTYGERIAGTYDIGVGPHFGSGPTIDTAAALFAAVGYARPA